VASQPPTTLVHPLGGGQPPSSAGQPNTLVHPLGGGHSPPSVPRPSHAPQTVPSGISAAAADARLKDLQAQAARARQELLTAQVDLRTARGEADNLRAELAVAKARIEELESTLKKAQSVPPGARGGDLKVIKGIGPKFEKLLHAAGVTSLAQIAAWTDADIDRMAKTMGVKPDRIRKDDWIGNAKRLAAGG
jgi:predicted flap endonuclease-1-like 5' DNA nuclease